MKSHATLIEIVAALGIEKRSVERRAIKESWPFEEQAGRGGKKRLYPLTSLPKAIRDKLQAVALHSIIVAPQMAPVTNPVPIDSIASSEMSPSMMTIGGLTRRVKGDDQLNDKDRARRDAAQVLCRAIEGAAISASCSIKRSIVELVPRILGGVAHPELIEAAQVTYTKPRACGQTEAAMISRLQKMYAAYEAGKVCGDAGRYLVPGRRDKEGHSPLLIHAFLIHYCLPTRPPVTEAWRNSQAWFAAQGLERPAVDTFYRIEKELPVTIKYRGRMTGSEWRSLLPCVARDVSMFKANDLWVGDGHSFKAKIQHPIHGQPFIPEVTVIIDWVSRKIVGWSVDLAESTIAVSAAFRHAQSQTRARPLVYYSDNGGGQIGKLIDCKVHGTLARQGIAHETGIPGNPQARGIIERLWQTTTIPLARTYPTCIWKGGDKEVTRKMLVALNKKDGSSERLLPSFNQFIADLDACLNDYNQKHEHRELGGRTPDQEYQLKLDPDSVDIGITDQELSAQWMPEVPRTPQRGIVSLFGNEYANKDLVHLLAEGEKVRVRFDIHNADRVWLYRIDGRYIGTADWDAHKRAAFPVPYMQQKREERAEGKIKHGERIIDEAHAELGHMVEGEVLHSVDLPAIEREAELVAVELPSAAKPEELGSYAETMQWLYGSHDIKDGEEMPHNEVAAL